MVFQTPNKKGNETGSNLLKSEDTFENDYFELKCMCQLLNFTQ